MKATRRMTAKADTAGTHTSEGSNPAMAMVLAIRTPMIRNHTR